MTELEFIGLFALLVILWTALLFWLANQFYD